VKKDLSPGPGNYNINTSFKKGNSTLGKFSKGERMKNNNRNMTPGPGYYDD
jgi:hypothetical protein